MICSFIAHAFQCVTQLKKTLINRQFCTHRNCKSEIIILNKSKYYKLRTPEVTAFSARYKNILTALIK